MSKFNFQKLLPGINIFFFRCNITHESTLAMLRQKHNGSIAEMGEQIDTLNKVNKTQNSVLK